MSIARTNRLWQTVGTKVLEAPHIGPGTEVAVVRSEPADPVVSEIIAAAARESGASVTIHQYPSFEEWREDLRLPAPIEQAIRNCDVLISHPYLSAAQFQWSKSVFGAMMDRNVSHMSFSPSADVLAGPVLEWPHELAVTVAGTISERMFGNDCEIHVTDDRGTDLHLIGAGEATHPDKPSLLQAAQPHFGPDESPWGELLRIFPTGEVGWHPFDSATGTFVVDALDGYGVLDESVTWQIDDGALVEVTGGRVADHFEAALDSHAKEGTRKMIAEASFGFNPNCTWDSDRRGTAGLLPMAGTFHIATGISTNKAVPVDANPTHVDALNRGPTVTVDGETIMEDGTLYLLDEVRNDPTVREVAAEYGDPDTLLSPGTTDW
ncbi:hypothetical protein [Natrinema halophilum]|uniref:Leucyl aminopeptidase (Aminopeptidase T) n=1 Tax=Natrinema halophilum TaxID=1699371 RepID=A0A7D5GNZ4_9EURY|nr:hypothetical protein [Natrinema halophilum]QLG49833.1 hypothetical protein HYG82_13685 [Natrinema halophilum]